MEKKAKEKVKRALTIPTDYIEALADRIHQTNPTKEILINTLSGLYSVACAKGVSWRMRGEKLFRDAREATFEKVWKEELDEIYGIPKSKPTHKKKKNKSKNQNKK